MISTKLLAAVALLALAGVGVAVAQDKPEEPRRLAIGPEGVRFRVKQRTSVAVPGSNDWIEVFLEDITRGQVRLGIRTAQGDVLVTPRSVSGGDEVAFQIGGELYAIEVEYLNNLIIGGDYAELIVKQPGADQSIRTEVLALIEQELARTNQQLGDALGLLDGGEDAKARSAIQEARRSQEDLQHKLHWVQNLDREEAENVSMVRVRIGRVVPSVERQFDRSPGERALGRVLAGVLPPDLDIGAQVLEALVIGPAYRPNTIAGIFNPDEKRKDLLPGRSINLNYGDDPAYPTRYISMDEDDEGKEFWLVISPPLAIKGITRMGGTSGRSRIVFAMQVKPRRAK